MTTTSEHARPLKLRAGEIVEVLSVDDILRTLDNHGTVNGMPFMPEMLAYCGRRYRVAARADKTCDTINYSGSRRLYDTVHLEGLRCDGSAHGGCQARCLFFWNEAWLRRVSSAGDGAAPAMDHSRAPVLCDLKRLSELAIRPADGADAPPRYTCQITEILPASSPLAWWDVRQYVRDVRSGNVGVIDVVKAVLFRCFCGLLRIGAYRALLGAYNRLQAGRGGTPYPYRGGTLDKTPKETLGMRAGELVQVKSYDEILATLSKRNRNQGLWFDPEMVRYCGSVQRVLGRLERIIDERSGRMITLSSDCLILEGVVCRAEYSEKRLFCPRSLYPYWREIWLKRVDEAPLARQPESAPAGKSGG